MNNYGLFFTRDDLVVRLPINPESLPVTRGTENDDYNVLGIGPIMAPRLPSLKEVQISSFFPGRVSSYVLTSGAFREPEFYINFFQSAMTDRAPILYTPVRYYEDGAPFMVNDPGMTVLVTQFDTEERGGETGDFYYDLTLTEYKDYSPLSLQVEQQGQNQPAKASTEQTRNIPAGQLTVGATVIANGTYYYTSYGESPSNTLNGATCLVSRIVTTDVTRPYPVHVTNVSGGALGWMKKSALQVVSDK